MPGYNYHTTPEAVSWGRPSHIFIKAEGITTQSFSQVIFKYQNDG
jgi:hypothetical protein